MMATTQVALLWCVALSLLLATAHPAAAQPPGFISTVSGNGAIDSAAATSGTNATAIKLTGPCGLAARPDGSWVMADCDPVAFKSKVLLNVSTTLVVSVLYNFGSVAGSYITALAVLPTDGSVIVADGGRHVIWKVRGYRQYCGNVYTAVHHSTTVMVMRAAPPLRVLEHLP